MAHFQWKLLWIGYGSTWTTSNTIIPSGKRFKQEKNNNHVAIHHHVVKLLCIPSNQFQNYFCVIFTFTPFSLFNMLDNAKHMFHANAQLYTYCFLMALFCNNRTKSNHITSLIITFIHCQSAFWHVCHFEIFRFHFCICFDHVSIFQIKLSYFRIEFGQLV